MPATMLGIFAVWSFALGLAVGSFLNVCIYRLPRNLSLRGRSFCPHCGHVIRARDLVPLFSQLALGGRCRDCGAPISWRYFAVELLSGLTFLGLYLLYAPQGNWLALAAAAVVFPCLIVAFFTDLETTIIPDQCWIIIAVVGVVYDLARLQLGQRAGLWQVAISTSGGGYVLHVPMSLVGFVVGGVGLYLFVKVADFFFGRETMGWGDVKFTAAAGTILGPGLALVAYLIIAALAGLVAAVPVLLWRKKRKTERAARKKRRGKKGAEPSEEEPLTLVPFGPFLALSLAALMVFGDKILPLVRAIYAPWKTGGAPWP